MEYWPILLTGASLFKNHVFISIYCFVVTICLHDHYTGAISISKMMMVNHSLQELYIWGNKIGDDGISAVTGTLSNCKIGKLVVEECDITLTGARLLATALYSSNTIRELLLKRNFITVEGALLIVSSAVHNTVCQDVSIDTEYKNEEIQKMMNILKDRRRQRVRDLIWYLMQ